jgi:ketosteroid isomerase-like protein
MEMEAMRSISVEALPRVILDHVAAYRSHDMETFMAMLASDALVNDIQREFLGRQAIRAWAEKEIFGANVRLEIEHSFEHFGNTIVRFRVDGDFDKSNLPVL